MEISAEYFKEATGHDPIQDDLERSNCKEAGELGHGSCGWNHQRDMPVFMVGVETTLEKLTQEEAALLLGQASTLARLNDWRLGQSLWNLLPRDLIGKYTATVYDFFYWGNNEKVIECFYKIFVKTS
jgi:hypothetical protein